MNEVGCFFIGASAVVIMSIPAVTAWLLWLCLRGWTPPPDDWRL